MSLQEKHDGGEPASILSEPMGPADYREPATFADPEGFRALVQARRAVRVYSGEPVPEATMRSILDLALLAPSSSNLQPAEFYWVRDPAKKARLVEACLDQPSAATAAELIVVVARTATWRGNARRILADLVNVPGLPQAPLDYYRKIVPFAMAVGPFGVIGLVKRAVLAARRLVKATPQPPVSRADLRVWAHTSTALAAQTLMLGARAYGFDTCPMGGFDPVRIERLLNLPRDAEVQMVVSVGRRAEQGVYGQRTRLAAADFIKIV